MIAENTAAQEKKASVSSDCSCSRDLQPRAFIFEREVSRDPGTSFWKHLLLTQKTDLFRVGSVAVSSQPPASTGLTRLTTDSH